MNADGRLSAVNGRSCLFAFLLSGLVIVAAGCGVSARASRTGVSAHASRTSGAPEQVSDVPARCQGESKRHPDNIPKPIAPRDQPILAGPIVVGCGQRLGEPIRFVAYVQATTQHGEQLCYNLEQPRQKAAIGGSCFQTAPALPACEEDCPLTVTEATVGKSEGKQASKASLVTGAASGVMDDVQLSTAPLRNHTATEPFIVVLRGSVREELRLPGVVSLFASMIVPCIPARQEVYARGHLSGAKEVSMQGSDPFACQD